MGCPAPPATPPRRTDRARGSRPGRGRRLAAVIVGAAFAVIVAGPGPVAAERHPDAITSGTVDLTGPATSANARYLVEVYARFLGRQPDDGGIDHHLAGLAAGGDRTRARFMTELLGSEEARRHAVVAIYSELLDRQPDGAGLAYWTDHLQRRGLHDLRILIVASDEYHGRAGGTDAAWLEAAYGLALGRATDATGLAYWQAELDAGVPRILVAAGIYLSAEALGHRADTLFNDALGRSPSASERGAAALRIGARGERSLLVQLWSSDELFERHLIAAGAG